MRGSGRDGFCLQCCAEERGTRVVFGRLGYMEHRVVEAEGRHVYAEAGQVVFALGLQ